MVVLLWINYYSLLTSEWEPAGRGWAMEAAVHVDRGRPTITWKSLRLSHSYHNPGG